MCCHGKQLNPFQQIERIGTKDCVFGRTLSPRSAIPRSNLLRTGETWLRNIGKFWTNDSNHFKLFGGHTSLIGRPTIMLYSVGQQANEMPLKTSPYADRCVAQLHVRAARRTSNPFISSLCDAKRSFQGYGWRSAAWTHSAQWEQLKGLLLAALCKPDFCS